MARDTTITERPIPPRGRLSFPMLMLRMIGNPVASWSEDFYEEPLVVYRWLGLENAFVMDPELIQTILLDDAESFTKRPLYDHVLGGAGGKGLLIAEGEEWRWQRRTAAPPCGEPPSIYARWRNEYWQPGGRTARMAASFWEDW
jgi:cytochrome P450